MPLEGIDPEAVDRMAGQEMAAEMLTTLGTATGTTAAREVRNGRPVQRYGTTWDEVRTRLDDRFPNHGFDMNQARAVFENTRDATFEMGLVRTPGQGEGERNELTQYMQHIPVARHIYNIMESGAQKATRDRIESGQATQRDYFDYQQRLRNERYQGDRPLGQRVAEGIAAIPAFGGEMALAGPFATGAAGAVGMPLGAGATSLLGRAVQAAPGWLAGEAVRAAAMPANAASSIFQRINPHVGEADATLVDVFKGYLDHQIEVASESLGEPISKGLGSLAGGIAARLPSSVRSAAVASAVANIYRQSLGSARFQNRLKEIGFHGLFGEVLEERAGEIARGLTGVEDDYGMTGNLLAGFRGDGRSFMAGVNQLVEEGLTLGGFSVITGLLGTASTRLAMRQLRSQGLSQAQAESQIHQTTMNALRDPTSVEQAPSGPLREIAQQVAQSVEHRQAEGPRPGLEGVETPAGTAAQATPGASEASPLAEAAPAPPKVAPEVAPAAEQAPVTAPQPAELSADELTAIGKFFGMGPNKLKKEIARGNPTVMQVVEAARAKQETKPPAAEPLPQKPLRERMLDRGRTATVGPAVQPLEALKPHKELKEPPLAKATSTAEVQRVLQEAPGFESPAAMFTAKGVSPIEQAVLKERFSDDYPSFATIATRLAAQGFTSPRGGPYASQRMKQIEQLALAKLGANESVHVAIAASRKQSIAEQSMDHADAIVDAGIKGEVSIVKAARQLQDVLDKIQNEEDKLADETTAKVNQAKAEGKTQAEIDAIMANFQEELKNAEKRARNASRQNRGAARSGQPGPESTVVPPGSRQNPVEAGQGTQAAGPAASADRVSPVQSAAVPRGGQALAAPQMTGLQKAQLARMKNPGQREYAQQNIARENMQAKTLFNAIVAQGGLNEASVTSYGLDLKQMKEDFPPRLFSRKGGIAVEELVGGSEIGRQIWGDRAETEADKQHRGDDLIAKLATHYLLEPGRWFENEQYHGEIEEYKNAIAKDLQSKGFGGAALEAEVNAQVARHLQADNREAVEANREPEEVGDAYEGPTTPGQPDFRSASDPNLAFHIGRGTAAAERSGPITPEHVKAVAGLSPHHGALVKKMQMAVMSSALTPDKKAEYFRNQLTILSNMPETAAALESVGLRGVNFHADTKGVGQQLAGTSELVRQVLASGDVVGGAYNRSTGLLVLDGGTSEASAARIAGHETGHCIDGLEEAISNSPEIKEAYLKEGLKGTLGDYARTDTHEFLAEVLGLIYSGEMSSADLQAKMPLTYAALLGRGLINAAKGKVSFAKPADVFDKPVNDGPQHADTLRLHVGHDIADDFKKVMAPGARGEFAQTTGNALRHGLADVDHIDKVQQKATAAANALFDRTIVNAADAMTRQAQFLNVADPLEKGTLASMPGGLQSEAAQAAVMIRDIAQKDENDLRSRGILKSFVEHYFGHIWEKPGTTPAQIGHMLARRPLEGPKSFQRERIIPTYRDGIDMGLTPASWNPIELALMKSREVRKAIMAFDLFQEIKQNGLAKFVKIGRQAPEGWAKLDDKMTQVLLKQKVGLVKTGEYWMPEQAHRILSNYLAPGLSGRSATYDILREYSNVLNSAQLGFGFFHAGFVLMDTMASAVSLAMQKISMGNLRGAATKAAEGLIPGAAAYARGKEGAEFWREYYSPGTGTPAMQKIVQAAIEGGFHLEMNKLVNGDAISKFRKALSDVKMGEYSKSGHALWHFLPAVSQLISKPTMEFMVPVMKAGVLTDLIRHVNETLPATATLQERRAAYAKVVDSVDNRLGELAYDNLHLNRTFKDVLMVGLRSVGWNIGTWREIAGGVKDIPKSAYGVYNGQGITPRTAYVGGLVMTAAFYGALYQVLMGAGWPQEPKDYFFPRTGRKRRDGRPERVSLPSYMRDIAHVMNRADEGPLRIASNAWHMGRGKINPGINSVIEMLNNENFFGQAIYDPRDPFWRQGIDLVKHVAGGLEPFSIRNLHPQARQLPPDAAIVSQGFFGITPSPSYIVNSWEQQRAIEAGQRHSLTPLEKLRRSRIGRR